MVGEAIYCAIDDSDNHFTSSTDDGTVEVATKNCTLVVPCTHVDMGIKLSVHGVNCAGEGDDFEIPLKIIGVIFLFGGVENADSKIVGGTESGDSGEFDVLGEVDSFNLFEDFFAFVDAGDDGAVKFLIFHKNSGYFRQL